MGKKVNYRVPPPLLFYLSSLTATQALICCRRGAQPCTEGQGDLVSGLMMGISRVTTWVIGFMNLLTKFP